MGILPNHEEKPNVSTPGESPMLVKANLKGDWTNIFLLLLLYTMQSLPLGITSVMPFILKNKKNVSYQDLALFSLSDWPFSLKLLWAPLVDAISVQKFGRRKSWLVPTQYLIGVILIFTANGIDNLLPETGKSNVVVLACVFIAINVLAATQDVAVDGWSLTILNKNNVGYAPMCNLVGHTIGMTSSVLPILFTSESFSNNYIRITPDVGGIITMKCLLYVWGITFLLVTTLIAIFKKENRHTTLSGHDQVNLNVIQTYLLVFKILKLPNIKILTIAMFTSKIGFAAADGITTLKVIDMGVSKDNILMISTAMLGVNAIVIIVFAKTVTGFRSMIIFQKAILIRLFLNVPLVLFIYCSPQLITFDGVVTIPIYFYTIFVLLKSIQNMLHYIMMLSSIAFFSRISDPRFGGTYMTLLNTISNLGSSLSTTVALGAVDWLTFNECSLDSSSNCSTAHGLKNMCKTNNSECVKTVDGYYVEMALCTVAGIAWYVFFRNIIKNLHTKSASNWLAVVKTFKTENDKTAYTLSVM